MAPTSKMLRFVETAQQMPEKRAAAARKRDFGEIYDACDKKGAET